MRKLKKAKKPHSLHVNFYPPEWACITEEAKGTDDEYGEVVRKAVRAYFNLPSSIK